MLSLYTNFSIRLRRDEKGATAVEYGIMVALIAVVIIVAVTTLGGQLNTMFETVSCQLKGGAMAVPAGSAAGTAASCTK